VPRWAAAGAGAVIFMASLLLWGVDISDELDEAQAQTVRQFVVRTQSQAVLERFNEAVADRRLTVTETQSIIETAKESMPEYGFLTDQKTNE